MYLASSKLNELGRFQTVCSNALNFSKDCTSVLAKVRIFVGEDEQSPNYLFYKRIKKIDEEIDSVIRSCLPVAFTENIGNVKQWIVESLKETNDLLNEGLIAFKLENNTEVLYGDAYIPSLLGIKWVNYP
jgi:hypothetical protein